MSERTRHLLINGWFWGQPATGSGQYLHGLLHHLPAALPGWRTTLLIPRLSENVRNIPPPGVELAEADLPAYARGARLIKLAWEQRVFPSECRRLQADVAFVPYWGSPLLPPCPTLVTIHDLIPMLLDNYAAKPTARAYTWLVAQSARRAAAVLTVSHSAQEDIVRHLRIPPERVYVTYEAPGTPHAPVTDAAELQRVRSAYNLPESYLLYLGGFDPRKNVPLLLQAYGRALRERPGIPLLLIAGRLPDPNDDWFDDPRSLIAELGIEGHVRTLGFVLDADKPALYTLASLFLFPSRYEGFGLPPLEALSCGTPALVSDGSSLPEVVGDTLAPVPVDDETAFADAILRSLDRPTDHAVLLAQAARFTWTDTAAIIARIIQAQL
ncbi:MAG: glycosyltransferase family 4 protein [Caldilineales bacterium]|nr:glycosyltransferase family 4 protein [Caldilineales bacterium]